MNREELSDIAEEVHNGAPIDWDSWGGLSNITPAQAARLAFHIDPIQWPGMNYKQGAIPRDLLEKITKLEQLLRNWGKGWSLNNLVIFFDEPEAVEICGKDFAPYGMVQQKEKCQRELNAEQEQREAEVAKERNEAGRYTLEEASKFIEARTGESARDIYAMMERDANAIPSKLTVYEPDSKIPLKQRTRVFGWYVEAYWDDLNKWLEINCPRLDCYFPEPSEHARQAEPEQPGTSNNQCGKTYDKQKESFQKWLVDSGVDISVLTVAEILKQIKLGCAPKDKLLWNIQGSTFRRNFWQAYSKEYDIKKKGGRRAGK